MLISRFVVLFISIVIVSSQFTEDSSFSGVNIVIRAIRQCGDSDILTCLKLRAAKSLDKIISQEEVSIIDGLSFQKVPGDETGRNLVEPLEEVDERRLPADPVDRENAVDKLLLKRLEKFFSSHSLKLGFPRSANEGRGSGGGGGGGGGKGGGGGLIIGSLVSAGISAMMMGGIALIAGKALLVAKVAMVIAAVIGLHKLTHSNHESHQVIHGGYDRVGRFRRSARDRDAHDLAYNAHRH